MKKKKKFRTSEAAIEARKLDKDWQALQDRWKPATPVKITRQKLVVDPESVRQTDNAKIKSLGLWVTGAVSSKPNEVYTGSKMKGVAQMSKSNAVPVFDSESIIDISHMRR